METNFAAIASVIKNRRTIKPAMMNGHKIPNGEIAALLELADWAPTHGFTEPWRFVVMSIRKLFVRNMPHFTRKTHSLKLQGTRLQ